MRGKRVGERKGEGRVPERGSFVFHSYPNNGPHRERPPARQGQKEAGKPQRRLMSYGKATKYNGAWVGI